MRLVDQIVLLAIIFCSCPSLFAQQALSSPQSIQTITASPQSVTSLATTLPLTLDEAIAMARARNPRLQEASASTAQALAGVQTARAYTNPSVEVFEGRQYARPIPTPGVPGLLQHYAAYQPIEVPRERSARRRAAELLGEASRYAQQGVTLSVVADTKHAFYEALRRREEIEHQQENLALVQDLHRRVAVEVDVGEKGGLELTRASAELARARFAVTSAQLEYAQAIARLRVTIAAPADAAIDPRGSLENRVPLPPLPEMRTLVFNSHPALRQTEKDKQAAQATLERQRALRIPQPILFGEFENQPDLRFWRTGVTVPLPIFDRRQGPIAEAKAAITRTDAVLEQRRLELTSTLERSYEQYQLADQQVTSLEAGPLRAAESAVQGAQAAYRFGERGLVEVLDAQRVLQIVRGDLLDARFARQSALVDLEELGALMPSGVQP